MNEEKNNIELEQEYKIALKQIKNINLSTEKYLNKILENNKISNMSGALADSCEKFVLSMNNNITRINNLADNTIRNINHYIEKSNSKNIAKESDTKSIDKIETEVHMKNKNNISDDLILSAGVGLGTVGSIVMARKELNKEDKDKPEKERGSN